MKFTGDQRISMKFNGKIENTKKLKANENQRKPNENHEHQRNINGHQ